MDVNDLRFQYDRLLEQGTRLAGRLIDVPQRATVYHHIFFESGRNHVFPLIAAHGALWARGYFAFGLRLAQVLSWQHALDPALRQRNIASVTAFADVLRDINRRVCADTYASYHFAARHGRRSEAVKIIDPVLLESLLRVHAARKAARELSDAERRKVFQAHFLHEQATVVGPTIAEALARLQWPLVRFIAMKPVIRFTYFPAGRYLWFSDFSSRDERIANGFTAFELAAKRGWERTAAALRQYAVLPDGLFADPHGFFLGLREALLEAAAV